MPRGALKSSLLLVGTLGLADAGQDPGAAPSSIRLRDPADLESIVGVVQAWARAWHRGDTAAMQACLHPDLDKVVLQQADSSVRRKGGPMGIQAELGRAVPDDRRRVDVQVLDARGRCASVRVDLGPWTAYLHLAAHRDRWAIAQVLWEWR